MPAAALVCPPRASCLVPGYWMGIVVPFWCLLPVTARFTVCLQARSLTRRRFQRQVIWDVISIRILQKE